MWKFVDGNCCDLFEIVGFEYFDLVCVVDGYIGKCVFGVMCEVDVVGDGLGFE